MRYIVVNLHKHRDNGPRTQPCPGAMKNHLGQRTLLSMTPRIKRLKDHIKAVKMSRLRIGKQANGYSKVPTEDSGFSDAQFELPPPKVPWKAISLAAFLFIVGTVLLIVGSLIVSGHIDTKYSDRLWPMIVLGAIMFLPGAYHVRIAYYAFNEYPGYSFSDIPEFE